MKLKLPINRALLFAFLLPVVQCLSQEKNKNEKTDVMVYKDDEAEIPFPGSFIEKNNREFTSIINDCYVSGYFYDIEKKIHYYPEKPSKVYYDPETGAIGSEQRVITQDGYLSSMYVLPEIKKSKLLHEIKLAFKRKSSDYIFYADYRPAKRKRIGSQLVYNWQIQHSKTRLEHYLVIGKKHNYLFISSPYGEQDYIESIIKEMKIKRE